MSTPVLHPRMCAVCGCTDEEACEGGCRWVEDDLCSRCSSLHPYPACAYCGSIDCTRMGGLVLCTQPQIREGD